MKYLYIAMLGLLCGCQTVNPFWINDDWKQIKSLDKDGEYITVWKNDELSLIRGEIISKKSSFKFWWEEIADEAAKWNLYE